MRLSVNKDGDCIIRWIKVTIRGRAPSRRDACRVVIDADFLFNKPQASSEATIQQEAYRLGVSSRAASSRLLWRYEEVCSEKYSIGFLRFSEGRYSLLMNYEPLNNRHRRFLRTFGGWTVQSKTKGKEEWSLVKEDPTRWTGIRTKKINWFTNVISVPDGDVRDVRGAGVVWTNERVAFHLRLQIATIELPSAVFV